MSKNILITGCSSGIGKYEAVALKNEGWSVFATAREDKDIIKLRELGVTPIFLELLDSSSIKECYEKVIQKTDRKIDAIILNAGGGYHIAVEDASDKIFKKQFQMNLFGHQELLNLFIPLMRKQKYGRIIYMGSIMGKISVPFTGLYCSTKYAIEAISDALRHELADDNIKVILIEPGAIKSKIRENSKLYFDEAKLDFKSDHYEKYYNKVNLYRDKKNNYSTTSGPKAVHNYVKKALYNKYPKSRYVVTIRAKIAAIVKKYLPEVLFDYCTKIYMKINVWNVNKK